jgi:hypothetical protein
MKEQQSQWDQVEMWLQLINQQLKEGAEPWRWHRSTGQPTHKAKVRLKRKKTKVQEVHRCREDKHIRSAPQMILTVPEVEEAQRAQNKANTINMALYLLSMGPDS